MWEQGGVGLGRWRAGGGPGGQTEVQETKGPSNRAQFGMLSKDAYRENVDIDNHVNGL